MAIYGCIELTGLGVDVPLPGYRGVCACLGVGVVGPSCACLPCHHTTTPPPPASSGSFRSVAGGASIGLSFSYPSGAGKLSSGRLDRLTLLPLRVFGLGDGVAAKSSYDSYSC